MNAGHVVRPQHVAVSRRRDDGGSAVLEFVFLAVAMLVPLLYLIVCVATVQRSRLAVTEAARAAGRAFATSDHPGNAAARMRAAIRIALTDQGLPDAADVRFVAAGASCDASRVQPRLEPGAAFTVCVLRRAELPALPALLQGRGITTVGRFSVHVDEYRSAG